MKCHLILTVRATFKKDVSGILSTQIKHTFKFEGTHFVIVKVTSQRNGNNQTSFTRIHNFDKNRVVVF